MTESATRLLMIQQKTAGITQMGSMSHMVPWNPVDPGTGFLGVVRRPVSRVLSPIDIDRGMAIHLGRPSPDASRDQPGRRSETPVGSHGPVPPLFGLAPGGVYPATAVASGAVRSYRTLSPLPGRNRAVCFLWHFPWGRPRRVLPGTVFPWSPDFPPPPHGAGAAIRPSDHGSTIGRICGPRNRRRPG